MCCNRLINQIIKMSVLMISETKIFGSKRGSPGQLCRDNIFHSDAHRNWSEGLIQGFHENDNSYQSKQSRTGVSPFPK